MRDPNEIADALQGAFASMPDAELRVFEPRYVWWDTVLRKAVLEAADALRSAHTWRKVTNAEGGVSVVEVRSDNRLDTHGPGFLPGDTADVYRWILVPSATVETLRLRIFDQAPEYDDAIDAVTRDIVARWDAATEEIEL